MKPWKGWAAENSRLWTQTVAVATSFGQLKNVKLTDVPSMARLPQAELQAMELQSIGFEAIDVLKTLAASGQVVPLQGLWPMEPLVL